MFFVTSQIIRNLFWNNTIWPCYVNHNTWTNRLIFILLRYTPLVFYLGRTLSIGRKKWGELFNPLIGCILKILNRNIILFFERVISTDIYVLLSFFWAKNYSHKLSSLELQTLNRGVDSNIWIFLKSVSKIFIYLKFI